MLSKDVEYWDFLEKNWKPTVKDINGKFQGGRVKVVGILGGIFLEGLMQKSEKFQGVIIKLTGNPGGQLQKISSTGGGVQFFLDKPIIS